MHIKQSANIDNLKPQLWAAFGFCRGVFLELGLTEAVLASGSDGKHKRASLHYDGFAFDLRTHNIPPERLMTVYSFIKTRLLLDGYDVVLEDQGTPNEHIHIEYDPKPGGPIWLARVV